MSVPKLRFKADDGSEFPEWGEKRLGDIMISLEYGMNAPAMKFDGRHKYLRITDIDDESHRYLSDDVVSPSGNLNEKYLAEKGDIFFARTGASVGKTYLYDHRDGELYFAGFLIRGKVKTSYNPYYIFTQTLTAQYLEWVKIMSARSGQPGINANEYASYKFFCASDTYEQKKIAVFFKTLDNVINQTQSEIDAWEKQKRGVMQLLFGQKVRFKADDGSEFPEWISIKLNGILNEYREMSEKGGIYEHASLTKEGVILKTERYDRDFLVKDETKAYRVTHKNDICYNPANLKFGVICRNKLGDVIFSPIYVTFKVNLSYDPVFVEYLVTRPDFINYALRYEEGTVYERMAVKQEDLLSISVNVPCTEEQKKIAACLSTFDTIIDRAKQELAAYRELKKGLLQQMFV